MVRCPKCGEPFETKLHENLEQKCPKCTKVRQLRARCGGYEDPRRTK